MVKGRTPFDDEEKIYAIIYVSQNEIDDNDCEIRNSIQFKEKVLREYCKLKGYEVARVYSDRRRILDIVSYIGSDEDDYQLLQLISDYAKGRFDYDIGEETTKIITTDLLELSSDINVQYIITKFFSEYASCDDVSFETLRDGILGEDFVLDLEIKKEIKRG